MGLGWGSVMSAGFAAVPNWLVEEPTVSSHEKLVYLVLSSKIGDQGAWFIGHSKIAEMAGISVSSVQRALKALNERGVVSWREYRNDQGVRTGNQYRLIVDRLGQGDRYPRSQGPIPPVSVTDHKKNPKKEPDNTLSIGIDERISQLWRTWPSTRRSTRKVVQRSLQTALKADDWELIIAGAIAHGRVFSAWPKNDHQYVPLLSTWLNQEGWTGATPLPRTPQHGGRPVRQLPPGVKQNDQWMHQ